MLHVFCYLHTFLGFITPNPHLSPLLPLTGSYTWNVGLTNFPPPSRSLHTAVVRGNDMVVVGGVTEGRALLNDTWALSVGTCALA